MGDSVDHTVSTTPTPDSEQLLNLARRAMAALNDRDRAAVPFQDEQDGWITRTSNVLARNLASGRLSSVRRYSHWDRETDVDLLAYAGQVLEELLAESSRVERLVQGESQAWAPVITRMERLAHLRLSQAGPAEWALSEAREVASYTCAEIWRWLQTNSYPFDVPFDNWAARWLTNRIRELARKQRSQDRYGVESLDRPLPNSPDLTLQDTVRDTSFEQWLETAANREALLQALKELKPTWATVVRLWYLEEWPADEIAAYLSQSVDYVYVLRFRAIEKLRKIACDERFGLAGALSLMQGEQRRLQVASGSEDK